MISEININGPLGCDDLVDTCEITHAGYSVVFEKGGKCPECEAEIAMLRYYEEATI